MGEALPGNGKRFRAGARGFRGCVMEQPFTVVPDELNAYGEFVQPSRGRLRTIELYFLGLLDEVVGEAL
jgi:hypothetical protein